MFADLKFYYYQIPRTWGIFSEKIFLKTQSRHGGIIPQNLSSLFKKKKMTEKIITTITSGNTLAGNPSEVRYYAEPEIVVPQPDGGELITRAKYQGSFTPNGKPVKSTYTVDTLSFRGNWSDIVDDKPYRGKVIINMGPGTEVETRPKWQPYDRSNSGSDYC